MYTTKALYALEQKKSSTSVKLIEQALEYDSTSSHILAIQAYIWSFFVDTAYKKDSEFLIEKALASLPVQRPYKAFLTQMFIAKTFSELGQYAKADTHFEQADSYALNPSLSLLNRTFRATNACWNNDYTTCIKLMRETNLRELPFLHGKYACPIAEVYALAYSYYKTGYNDSAHAVIERYKIPCMNASYLFLKGTVTPHNIEAIRFFKEGLKYVDEALRFPPVPFYTKCQAYRRLAEMYEEVYPRRAIKKILHYRKKAEEAGDCE